MPSKAKAAQLVDDGLEEGLAAVIAELENAAIARAKTLITEEAQVLREKIRKLEEQIVRLQQRPQTPSPTGSTTPKPGGTAKQPEAPGKPSKQVRRTARPPGPRELPPLPPHRTLATVGEYLKSLGFHLVSNRAIGGGAWVFKTQAEFGHVAEHLKKNGIGVSRYPQGRKLYSDDHFEIDPSKVLPDK